MPGEGEEGIREKKWRGEEERMRPEGTPGEGVMPRVAPE